MGCDRGVGQGSVASLVYESSSLSLLLSLGREKAKEAKGEVVGNGLHGLAANGSYEGDIGSNDGSRCTGENGGTQADGLVGAKSRERSVMEWMSPNGSSESSGVRGSQCIVA